MNIPLPELGHRLDEIPAHEPVGMCCASGMRSGVALSLLKKNGCLQAFNVSKRSDLLE